MENQQPTIEEVLANMEKMSGGDPRPMRVLAAINPAFAFEQARGKKFVMVKSRLNATISPNHHVQYFNLLGRIPRSLLRSSLS